jgi:hypothetical protein
MSDQPPPHSPLPEFDAEAAMEDLAARRVTSKYSTRVHVLVEGEIARITFGEIIRPGETNWHSSITMRAFDAIALADLIWRQDTADQKRIIAASAPLKGTPGGGPE